MKYVLVFSFLLSMLFIGFSHTDAQALYHGSRQAKNIALTFDACPSTVHGGYDSRIIRTLVDSGVPATFFPSGTWIRKHKKEVKDIAAVPLFELGNHSFSHPHCTEISDDSIRQELLRTASLLNSTAGTSAKLFRPPYGETDKRIEDLVWSLGFNTVMFDLASGDPDTTISRERLIQYVVTNTKNGSIIVMHVNGRGRYTAEALPHIIQGLHARGFIFSKVSELLLSQQGKQPLRSKQ